MKKKILILGVVLGAVVAVSTVAAIPVARRNVRIIVTTAVARVIPSSYRTFPAVDREGLSPGQLKIIDLVRTEYQSRPVSYDSRVLKYTQGNKEAWCTDFISWVMKQVGTPYVNPNSGGWRIPGVYTLRDYFVSKGQYIEVGRYTPKPGDVAFYIGKHTFDLFSTEHVAIVLKVQENTMTTLGGNENGRLMLDTQKIEAGENSLVGFGKLEE